MKPKVLAICSVFWVLVHSISADPITTDRDLYIWLHHYFEGKPKEFIVESLQYLGEREVVDESTKISLVSFYSKCLLDEETRTIVDTELKTPKSTLLNDIISQAKVFDIDSLLASSNPSITLNYQCLAAYSATGDSKYLEYLLSVYLNHVGEQKDKRLFISAVRAGEMLNMERQILDSVRYFLDEQKKVNDSPLITELISPDRGLFMLKYFDFMNTQIENGIWEDSPNI